MRPRITVGKWLTLAAFAVSGCGQSSAPPGYPSIATQQGALCDQQAHMVVTMCENAGPTGRDHAYVDSLRLDYYQPLETMPACTGRPALARAKVCVEALEARLDSDDPEMHARRARERPLVESLRTNAEYKSLFDACVAVADKKKLLRCDTPRLDATAGAQQRECERQTAAAHERHENVASFLKGKGIDSRDFEFFGLKPRAR